jgi:hypothetical protein
MRLAAVFFAFACVSGFAQDNVAAESAKKRIGSFDLMNPKWLGALNPVKLLQMARLNPPAPGYCAIPLVNAMPEMNSRMPVLSSRDVHDKMDVRVPAPACK